MSLHTEAVAAKAKVVGIDTRAVIPKVECGFARVRCSRIAIRYKHLRQRKTVEQAPAIVMDIVQCQAFTIVEANPEAPAFPGYLLALDIE